VGGVGGEEEGGVAGWVWVWVLLRVHARRGRKCVCARADQDDACVRVRFKI